MFMSHARVRFLLGQVIDASIAGDWGYATDLVSMYQPAFWRFFRSGAGRRYQYRGLVFRNLCDVVQFVVDNAFRSARPPAPYVADRYCAHMSDMAVAPREVSRG